jgi:agarase
MLLRPARSSQRSLIALSCICASLLVGVRCELSAYSVHRFDLGGGLSLWTWQVAEGPVAGGVREVEIAGKLVGPLGRIGEAIVLAASRDSDVVVVDADLRFGPHDPGRPVARGHGDPPEGDANGEGAQPWRGWPGGPSHTPNRDTIRVRVPADAPFDPYSLGFTALDRFGGALAIATHASGRFRVEVIDGRHWLVTPEGHAFFSAGINHTTPGGDFSPPLGFSPYNENILTLYGSEEAWAEVAEERLRSWGVNTLGAWSNVRFFDQSLPHAPVLSLNRAAPPVPGWPTGQTGQAIRDYFDPAFEGALAARIEGARPCAENPWCIGVFTDNELPWGRSVLQIGTYVDAYLTLPPGAPGKRELQAFFEERYGDVAAFNAAWSMGLASFDEIQQLTGVEDDEPFCNEAGRRADRQAFVARVAARYFERVHAALRGAFPDLLILGSRLLGVYTSPDIVAAAAPWVDVVSVNNYDWDEDGRGLFKSEGEPLGYLFLDDAFSDLETVHEISGKPVLISEWTYRTPTPDVPVLFPPFIPTVQTQAERADRYAAYMGELLSRPYVVGSHWFKFHDQPATGRGDGENSLFGVVNIEDTPYPELTERMTAVNATLSEKRLVAGASGGLPTVSSAAASGASTSSVTSVSLIIPAPLGERVFSVTQPGADRTGFFVFILPGSNVAASVDGGPLRLEADIADADGVASLRLVEDVVLAFRAVVGDVACLRLQAAGSHGELACDGGFGHDVVVTQASGAGAPPPVTEAFLGVDSGPGAATLLAPFQFLQLPSGSSPAQCLGASYPPPTLGAFTTGVVTSTKGTRTFDTAGENFVCGPDGAAWRTEDGPGMLVVGVPTFDSRVPGGDLASSFRIADTEQGCIP